MKTTRLEYHRQRLTQTSAILFAAIAALFFMSGDANAQSCGYGNYGGGYAIGYRSSGISIGIGGYGGYGRGISVGYSSYRPRGGWHDTSHYDYHPATYIRHRNHYDYRRGHYDLHRSGHRHH